MSVQTQPARDAIEILIVEDSPTQAEQLRYLLAQQGYRVLVASDGQQAVALLSEHEPALVITDIVMPGMNGYQLCQQIKADERTQDVPVILLTSLADPADVLDGLACGADNFITKPYSADYLLAHIEQILANRELRKGERVRLGMEIIFAGKRRFITADQQQMLTLLISTYEAAVQRNAELVEAQDELRSLNEHLEDLVETRTTKLLEEIEERKRTEEQLRESAERFRVIFENASEAIHICNVNDEILEVNQRMCELMGYTREELLRLHVADLMAPEVRRSGHIIMDEFAQHDTAMFEGLNIHRNGQCIPVEISIGRIERPAGDLYVSIVRDITERKQAEERIRRQVEELQRWYSVTLDRETRSLKLKHEVNELLRRLNEPIRYPSAA